jgi:diguanylate cyclase (GGDEF)-like protein
MSSATSDTPLSDQFGFDADWRESQLRLAALTVTDQELVPSLQELLNQDQRIASLVTCFYQYLVSDPQSAAILNKFDRERLQQVQADYLASFGSGLGYAEYFESRIRLALVHMQLGISASVYAAAFSFQQGLLNDLIIQTARTKKISRSLAGLVSKLTALEILIAHEVYAAALPQAAEQLPRTTRPSYETYGNRLQQDAMTGAAGRLTILKAINGGLETARRTGQALSLILVELDMPETESAAELKSAIEQVLREVVVRLKASVRGFDLIGRYGAHSFIMLLENTSLHTSHQIAERVRRRMHEKPVHCQQGEVTITVSQGITDALSSDDQDSLLLRCGRALEQARSAGGNCINEEAGLAAGR